MVKIQNQSSAETSQQSDLNRAGESLKQQANDVKEAVQGVADDLQPSIDNIRNDPSIVGRNLDRFNNAVKDWEQAAYNDWTKSFKDVYAIGESVVGGAYGEVKQIASDLATETAANQPLTASAKTVPKIAAALVGGGAKAIKSIGSGLKSAGGKISRSATLPNSKAKPDGWIAVGNDGTRITYRAPLAYPPNRGFKWTPRRKTLKKGDVISRYGDNKGSFSSPDGVPFEQRSLPQDAISKPLNRFKVLKPFDVDSGPAAPGFDQPGGGIQFDIGNSIIPNNTNFQTLIDIEYIEQI